MKVWSGFTKFIRSQTTQGKAVDTGILGIFYMDNKMQNKGVDSEVVVEFGKFYFQPTVKFLDEAEIILHENEINLNPYTLISHPIVKMNVSGIAAV